MCGLAECTAIVGRNPIRELDEASELGTLGARQANEPTDRLRRSAQGRPHTTGGRGGVTQLEDDVIIVRGGRSEVPRTGEPFSGAYGSSLEDAAAFVPHGSIRATTVGGIRSGGGVVEVILELTRAGVLNPRHVSIRLGRGSMPFPADWIPNPVPRSRRIR